MNTLMQKGFWVLLMAISAGCSVQKRTLMPGYHVELVGAKNAVSKAVIPVDELAEPEWAVAGSLPNEIPVAELTRPALLYSNATHMAQTHSIPPKKILVSPAPAELQEPTPWDRAYEDQKRFGNLALGTLGLAVLLHTTSAPQVALTMALIVCFIFFVFNRRKRREVIDIKELNGYDVTEERRQFRTGNRLLGGAVFAAVIAYIALAIVTALAFIALIEALFTW